MNCIQYFSHELGGELLSFLTSIFKWCKNNQTRMNDQTQAKSLVDAGNFAIESQNWERLSEINSGLLKSTYQKVQKKRQQQELVLEFKINTKMKNHRF
jgi:hypothetical protein